MINSHFFDRAERGVAGRALPRAWRRMRLEHMKKSGYIGKVAVAVKGWTSTTNPRLLGYYPGKPLEYRRGLCPRYAALLALSGSPALLNKPASLTIYSINRPIGRAWDEISLATKNKPFSKWRKAQSFPIRTLWPSGLWIARPGQSAISDHPAQAERLVTYVTFLATNLFNLLPYWVNALINCITQTRMMCY